MNRKVLLFTALLALASAMPDGAPDAACFTMLPDHGSLPQTSPHPFTISLSSTNVQPGQMVVITILSPTPFRGFMVQPRNIVAPNTPMGTFVRNDALGFQPVTCSGGPTTATHISNVPRTTQIVHWTAPVMNGAVVVQWVISAIMQFIVLMKRFWLSV